jgi:hypothetical protein
MEYHAQLAQQAQQVPLDQFLQLHVEYHLVHLVITFQVQYVQCVLPIHMVVVEHQLHAQLVQ